MSKIKEAQVILKDLGLPIAQQNRISALTLLALCNVTEDTDWSEAQKISLGISKGILRFMSEVYNVEYAENTREHVRRQVLHQFDQAGVVVRNPDDPNLPINSPKTHYGISEEAINAIKTFGTDQWSSAAKTFKEIKGDLANKYAQILAVNRVPVTLPNGETLTLSPGKHNEVQAAVVEIFRPQFAKDSELLYLGDTEEKGLYLQVEVLAELGVPIDQHTKLPDVVLYDREKNWLFLIEAVTSHGPVSPKRLAELEEMLKDSDAGRIYVTALPDFREFKRRSDEIAWDTEIWICEMPNHMIHFNGDRFLGPR